MSSCTYHQNVWFVRNVTSNKTGSGRARTWFFENFRARASNFENLRARAGPGPRFKATGWAWLRKLGPLSHSASDKIKNNQTNLYLNRLFVCLFLI